jgi:hypothetical protein
MKVAKLLAVVAVLGIAGSAYAQGRGGRGDPNLRPLTGQVVKVDGANVTVKVRMGRDANTSEVVVATDANTAVTIDATAAKVADLKADLYVTVTPRTGVAQKIVATKEQPRPPTRPARAAAAGGAAPAVRE